ncbi:MAG: CoB--CoM heterodisulfide reductase iron-sulfur subunit A family protein [Saprospiraceae bacterium]
MMKKKIGVYICHCGTNISDYVDVEKVRKAVENEEGVFIAKTTMFACSDSSQKEIIEDIKNYGLNGMVVASCSPKLHLNTFREVAERAGMNKYNYVHANIREQGSWAHSDNKEGATLKAIQLVKSAIAKARLVHGLEPNVISAKKSVAIIGAGVAGMKAAISIAEKNCPVFLIEREFFVGGRVSQWGEMFTTDETGQEVVTRLYNELIQKPNVTLFTGTEVIESSGSIGDFSLKLKKKPRYVKNVCDHDKFQKAIDVCPVEVPDEFNFNLTTRKAIYHNFPSEYPHAGVIDIDNCTRCGLCETVCKDIDFSQKEEIIAINVGSVLVASGFDPYTPKNGEYCYNEVENVITLPQFKRLIELNEKELLFNGKKIENIAYIYCVGSREPEGENTYCSRYCCTSAIHAALSARKKFKNIINLHFHRGIRTYGKQETLYYNSRSQGDIYIQAEDGTLPEVYCKDGKTMVKVKDILSSGREVEAEADLVVLITGMVPRSNNTIGTILKLPKGRDNFFNEIHMKLRPVETFIDGVTICGACQGPKNIMESVNSALAAATKSFSYINKGELETEPVVAEIDPNMCTWCDACTNACPYDAISKVSADQKIYATINNSVCKGCGMCLPVCPEDAIQLVNYSDNEIESMIDALAQG